VAITVATSTGTPQLAGYDLKRPPGRLIEERNGVNDLDRDVIDALTLYLPAGGRVAGKHGLPKHAN
jgi:hypothetical protein